MAIMNVACSLRNARDIFEALALRTKLKYIKINQLKPERRYMN
jgi:hypothetical protein